jgi:hypothetical protein
MPSVVVPQEVAALGYQQLQMRKKIALQMMMQQQQKAYPKNVGQGLSSVGNSIGDIGMMQQLQQQQAEYEARRQKMMDDAEEQAAATRAAGM